MRKMTSAPQGEGAMYAAGRAAQRTGTKLPEGYTAGGVPGGRGGGVHIGRSSHPELMRMGKTSPKGMKNGGRC